MKTILYKTDDYCKTGDCEIEGSAAGLKNVYCGTEDFSRLKIVLQEGRLYCGTKEARLKTVLPRIKESFIPVRCRTENVARLKATICCKTEECTVEQEESQWQGG